MLQQMKAEYFFSCETRNELRKEANQTIEQWKSSFEWYPEFRNFKKQEDFKKEYKRLIKKCVAEYKKCLDAKIEKLMI